MTRKMGKTQLSTAKVLMLFFIFLLLVPDLIFGQAEKRYIRKGNREYSKDNYAESEILYRKAAEASQSPEATFNIGDALYRQNKYEDAVKQFSDNTNQTVDSEKKSAAWYNMGNSLLQADKIQESIEAYKNALKLDPDNLDAKYNLGYAQNLLKEQQQQNQQNSQNNNQEQENKQDQNKEQQDGQNDQQQPQAQDQQQQQQQDQQSGETTLSKEDAERLLDALANDERDVQEKVKRDKAARARTRVLKNW